MSGYMNTLVDSMKCYIGQTVTVFTSSGGVSGCGFTGVLLSVDCNAIRLLCSAGIAPTCPIGSACCCPSSCGCGGGWFGNCTPMGSVSIIPTCSIVNFTHNAI